MQRTGGVKDRASVAMQRTDSAPDLTCIALQTTDDALDRTGCALYNTGVALWRTGSIQDTTGVALQRADDKINKMAMQKHDVWCKRSKINVMPGVFLAVSPKSGTSDKPV